MSQQNEPSYYEIALTNRQVLMVFVVLLVCVVVAFISGVWVGRGGESELPTMGVAEAVPSDTEEGSEAPEVGELNFFAEKSEGDRGSGALAQAAASPSSETTLLQDVRGDEDSAQSTRESPPPERVVDNRARTEPAPEPVEVASTSAATAAAIGQGEHVIQVFSSTDQEQAKHLIQTLTSGGYPAFLSPVDVRGQTMYRVRIGPYVDPKEAESVAERVRKSYRLDTWVTR
ncbi:MAG: SPOR domain-containing protein [Thermoanaerobaculia bacterium]